MAAYQRALGGRHEEIKAFIERERDIIDGASNALAFGEWMGAIAQG